LHLYKTQCGVEPREKATPPIVCSFHRLQTLAAFFWP
jgi:hypothetical protein